jgi:geranylgeranyl pyrophosphate synthase
MYPSTIRDKIKYILEDGKRLRPILYLIFSDCSIYIDTECTIPDNIQQKIQTNIIYKIASVIESIHCLSLVIDDLPQMDNDTIRRDKESFHKKYGVEYTNFIVYYMFNKLFASLALDICLDIDLTEMNLEIANNIKYVLECNLTSLIDGQYCDMEWTSFNKIDIYNSDYQNEKIILINLLDKDYINEFTYVLINNDRLELDSDENKLNQFLKNIELNMKKTSSLFNMSIVLGFLSQIWLKSGMKSGMQSGMHNIENANVNTDNYKNYILICKPLIIWANILGYLFQLSDDLLDYEYDLEKNKPNVCNTISYNNAIQLLKNGCEWLNSQLLEINKRIQELNNQYEYNFHLNTEIIVKIIEKIESRIIKNSSA